MNVLNGFGALYQHDSLVRVYIDYTSIDVSSVVETGVHVSAHTAVSPPSSRLRCHRGGVFA
jgi:hypothetical protein